MSRPLTARQQRFVDVYNGNATESARLAGYNGSDNALGKTGFDLLRHPKVRAAIEAREAVELGPKVMDRVQLQAFWTEIAESELHEVQHRLKASEYLARSHAAFKDRVEHSRVTTLEDLVSGANVIEVDELPIAPTPLIKAGEG